MTTTEYIYKDSAGVAVGTITRIDNKDGTKTFAPVPASPTLGRSTTSTSCLRAQRRPS